MSESGASIAVPKPKGIRADVDFLSGGGELGRLIRDYPWDKTPLGPLDGWPQSLKTATAILLAALTGDGRSEDRDRARAAGFDDHLVKPVDLAALTRTLQ